MSKTLKCPGGGDMLVKLKAVVSKYLRRRDELILLSRRSEARSELDIGGDLEVTTSALVYTANDHRLNENDVAIDCAYESGGRINIIMSVPGLIKDKTFVCERVKVIHVGNSLRIEIPFDDNLKSNIRPGSFLLGMTHGVVDGKPKVPYINIHTLRLYTW